MNSHLFITRNKSGFTLVELLVAMVVALLVSAAVYASYKIQQQTSNVQNEVTRVQQNLRAGMELMSNDLKHVGYDPYDTGNYAIQAGSGGSLFLFTADNCADGGAPKPAGSGPCTTGPYSAGSPIGTFDMAETFSYGLFDSDGDGVNDALMREPTATPAAVANNIEFIEFYYIMDNGTATLTPNVDQRPCIRSVRVTLVGRTDKPDYKYTNTDTYPRGSGAVYDPPDDNYRRRSLTRTIELRNMEIVWPSCT